MASGQKAPSTCLATQAHCLLLPQARRLPPRSLWAEFSFSSKPQWGSRTSGSRTVCFNRTLCYPAAQFSTTAVCTVDTAAIIFSTGPGARLTRSTWSPGSVEVSVEIQATQPVPNTLAVAASTNIAAISWANEWRLYLWISDAGTDIMEASPGGWQRFPVNMGARKCLEMSLKTAGTVTRSLT
ncbi:hypothetical protein FN846DRAFT_891537 [Sphaerosporella brunnea]|uniref:Uncharacterized protein n=1 Tax=Sphaerosporella brunnea TaxID=1250544 RepID=A0A5J5ET73_9PEZI|nr:hypothetical protein FN846DRAFT_891537 [Sphaerosporella brunnea]